MFSDSNPEATFIGNILKELNQGKSLGNILLESDWRRRAKILLLKKKIVKAWNDFQTLVGGNEIKTRDDLRE